ncbi:hypothetical protein [Candidatus Viridilinea mediisalina]|uniref:Uncharacterized protein n=1 Tax=Candidatus Viridilinea mediisalina TaxID=2024553 RepID=A0A2A6REB0_9CHLR|nr:hypothetical protein [Candidatus Viridilinea mediisalina]PDW01440.1 hypothetical protein CJ255_19065 [Candidatus Viridilinea mediisalina]
MNTRRLLIAALFASLLISLLGGLLFIQQRIAACQPVPGRPNLISFSGGNGLPDGWARRAGGVELRGPAVDGQGFDLDGDGRAFQLLGIGNFLQTPAVTVRPGQRLCFSGFALTDSIQRSPTRVRLLFQWRDAAGQPLHEDTTLWQPVVLWTPEAPPRDWSPIKGSFVAPDSATSLVVRIMPASDDRVYLDLMQVRHGGSALQALAAPAQTAPCCE